MFYGLWLNPLLKSEASGWAACVWRGASGRVLGLRGLGKGGQGLDRLVTRVGFIHSVKVVFESVFLLICCVIVEFKCFLLCCCYSIYLFYLYNYVFLLLICMDKLILDLLVDLYVVLFLSTVLMSIFS